MMKYVIRDDDGNEISRAATPFLAESVAGALGGHVTEEHQDEQEVA